jgi:hypothetical protein
VVCDTVSTGVNADFYATGTGICTIPEDGYYELTGCVSVDYGGAISESFTDFRVQARFYNTTSSVALAYSPVTNANLANGISTTDIAICHVTTGRRFFTAGTTIKLQVYSNRGSGGNGTISAGQAFTWVSIQKCLTE